MRLGSTKHCSWQSGVLITRCSAKGAFRIVILNPRSSVFIRGQCSYMRLPRRVIEITQLDEAAIRLVDLEDGCPGSVCFRGQRGDRPSISRAASRLQSAQEALIEANRCLNCFDAPCAAACPTHIDVPRFIKKIATQNLMGSALTILDANILGASCSRVCPVDVLCEGACVMLRYNKQPIAIGRLQRHAMDHFLERGGTLPKEIEPEAQPENRVHRRGAGVAGLRGRTGAAGVFRHRARAARAARWIEHIRRRGVQAARARQSARSGDDRRAGRRVPLRGFD